MNAGTPECYDTMTEMKDTIKTMVEETEFKMIDNATGTMHPTVCPFYETRDLFVFCDKSENCRFSDQTQCHDRLDKKAKEFLTASEKCKLVLPGICFLMCEALGSDDPCQHYELNEL